MILIECIRSVGTTSAIYPPHSLHYYQREFGRTISWYESIERMLCADYAKAHSYCFSPHTQVPSSDYVTKSRASFFSEPGVASGFYKTFLHTYLSSLTYYCTSGLPAKLIRIHLVKHKWPEGEERPLII